ncbi:MAG: CsbD family protein [Betaproteobacteria bacterium]
MNKDQIDGRTKEVKGKVKEIAGKLVGNKKLEAKGKAGKLVGKAQAKLGDVKAEVKKAVR